MDEQQFQQLKQENLRLRVTINQLEERLITISSAQGSLKNLVKKLVLKLDCFGIIDSRKGQIKRKISSLRSHFSRSKSATRPDSTLNSLASLSDRLNSSEVDILMCLKLTFGDCSLSDANGFRDSITDIQHVLCICLSSDYFHILDLFLKLKKKITLVESSDYQGSSSESTLYVYPSQFDSWLAKEKYGNLSDYDAILIPQGASRYLNLLDRRLSSGTKIFTLPTVS
jgi:hypothetical protein